MLNVKGVYSYLQKDIYLHVHVYIKHATRERKNVVIQENDKSKTHFASIPENVSVSCP